MKTINIGVRAATALLFLALSACGGGGGGSSAGGPNTPPTANFAFSCVDLVCNFTSSSTDQDVGDAIIAYNWTFGDGIGGAASTSAPAHTFVAAGAFDVTLMVADRAGTISSVTRRVTVSVPPVPSAPHANFAVGCVSFDCTFTDTTTYDAGSALQSRNWDFGDGVTVATTNPVTHHYAVTTLTTFIAKLTVTDTAGKTSTNTRSVLAAPPATSLNCVGGNCVLNLTQAARVSATLVSSSCSARATQVVLTAPVAQTIFPDGCFDPVGTVVAINGGTVFAANTQLQAAVLSGSLPTSAIIFPPTIRVTGDFASGWTLTFDDGYGGPGEPDFNDVVILIKATP